MPLIIRQNSSNIHVDAIVNITDSQPVINRNTIVDIYREAGPQLIEARRKIGKISPGQCAVTPAFDLDAKYVIHTVIPRQKRFLFWERRLLKRCYKKVLHTALELGCSSIAIPLLCTDSCRYLWQEAQNIALPILHAFLKKHEMNILLVINNRGNSSLSSQLCNDVKTYIDDHFTGNHVPAPSNYWGQTVQLPHARTNYPLFPTFQAPGATKQQSSPGRQNEKLCSPSFSGECYPTACPSYVPGSSLSHMLSSMDAGFSETLLRLIDKTGKKDSYIYKKAHVSKQHFSKIRNNPNYKPTKATAMAFAIALELDLDQTKDLIGRAGYALTNSSKFDVILTYFILHKRYDMYEINDTLFAFDQMLLGA